MKNKMKITQNMIKIMLIIKASNKIMVMIKIEFCRQKKRKKINKLKIKMKT